MILSKKACSDEDVLFRSAGLFKKLDDPLFDHFKRSYLPHFLGVVLPSIGRLLAF